MKIENRVIDPSPFMIRYLSSKGLQGAGRGCGNPIGAADYNDGKGKHCDESLHSTFLSGFDTVKHMHFSQVGNQVQ